MASKAMAGEFFFFSFFFSFSSFLGKRIGISRSQGYSGTAPTTCGRTGSLNQRSGLAWCVACFGFHCTRGRYLAAKSEADHYMRELKREEEEIITVPDTGEWGYTVSLSWWVLLWPFDFDLTAGFWSEAAEIAEILSQYGLQPHEYSPIVNSLRKNPQAWLEFMMKYVDFFSFCGTG